jgi:hypothetical protein
VSQPDAQAQAISKFALRAFWHRAPAKPFFCASARASCCASLGIARLAMRSLAWVSEHPTSWVGGALWAVLGSQRRSLRNSPKPKCLPRGQSYGPQRPTLATTMHDLRAQLVPCQSLNVVRFGILHPHFWKSKLWRCHLPYARLLATLWCLL